MYEDNTYEVILDRMLARIPGDIDKTEGSISYEALAPEAWELAQAYISIDLVYDMTFADTAPREELIRRAKERGLEPKPATYAVLKGQFNIDVPIGSRFGLDDLNYVVTDQISNGIYKMQCEAAGPIGNKKLGALISIEYIEGLTSSELIELLIPGTDEEDTEKFRARYFDSFNSVAFGGNKADYIEKIKSINGVGGVKVYRATQDNYNVVAQIINSDYGVPSTELVDIVQEFMDPTKDGEGEGMAPIGHVVVIQGVTGVAVNINTNITYDQDYTWDAVSENVKETVDKYFLSLAESWENTDNIIVRIAQLEATILNVPGIIDIAGTNINGLASNLTLESGQVPLRGDINANN